MADERLRLIAEFRDNASSGIRKLGREMGEIRETPGMSAAKKWMGDFSKQTEDFRRGSAVMGSTMSGLGVGGLALSGGIAAAVKSFKDLAEQTTGLKSISRETGIAIDTVNQFKMAARDMHVDPNAMTAGLQTFAGNMEEARRHLGQIYGELNQMAPDFARKITGEDATSAVKDVLGWLARIPEEQQRAGKSLADGSQLQKKWTAEFFGSDDLNKLVEQGPQKLAEAMERAAKNAPKITADMVAQADLLQQSINGFTDAVTNFETKVGPTVFKGLKDSIADFTQAFDQVEHAAEWFAKVKDHPVQALADAALGSIDDAAKRNSSGEDRLTRSGGPQEKMIFDAPGLASRVIHGIVGDKALGRGDFKPAQDDAERASRLTEMQTELDALKAKIAADHNPVGFAVRNADAMARERELRDAIGTLQGPGNSLLHKSSYEAPQQGYGGLLQKASYSEDSRDDDRGGLSSRLLDFRDAIQSGTKSGVMAAFREMMQERDLEKPSGNPGIMNASFETGDVSGNGSGRGRMPSLRYNRQHEGAAFTSADDGRVPTGAHDALKDLIAQRETGTTGAGGYDTVFGHAERGGALAPPKPVSQMTIADILAYQRRMKPQSGAAAFPVGRGQWTESTLRGLTRGMDPNTVFSPEVQEKLFDRSIANRLGQGAQGFREEWDSFKNLPDSQINNAIAGHREAMRSAGPRGFTGKGDAVGIAESMLGANGMQAQSMLKSKMTPGEWCADFVNGVIKGAGGQGVNSSMAAAFQTWGHAVGTNEAKRGDVIMENAHGNRINHVGMATGRVQRDKDGKVTAVEMVSGNYGSQVRNNWERTGIIAGLRRGNDPDEGRHYLNTPEQAYKDLQREQERAARPNLLNEATKAGLNGTTIKHEGGAVVEIRGLPQSKGTKVKTSGMVTAVNLRRGPTMTAPHEFV